MCQVHGESDGRADGVVRKGSDPFFFFFNKKNAFYFGTFQVYTKAERVVQ